MKNSIAATADASWVAEILSPSEIKLARLVAYTNPEYSWAQQYLRDFTPTEREELRVERERFLSNPEVQRILSAPSAH